MNVFGALQVGQQLCGLTVLQHLGSEQLKVSGKEGNTVCCIFTTVFLNSCDVSLLFRSPAWASPLPALLAVPATLGLALRALLLGLADCSLTPVAPV